MITFGYFINPHYMEEVFREITPLKKDQLYYAKFTPDDPMDFPFHSHNDYELTLCLKMNGKRIVGNLVEDVIGNDLVLIGPDVLHGYKWNTDVNGCDVAVIQFSRESSTYQMFHKGVLKPIGEMLSRVNYGIRFSKETIRKVKDKIITLHKTEGLKGFYLFIEILYTLATSKEYSVLSAISAMPQVSQVESKRVIAILKYVADNYMNKISLKEIATLVNMSPSSVCRYFKQKTKINFWDYLNNYRIDMVVLMMLKTDDYISEICYSCGFNNISNFNRAFKKRIGMSPSEYRQRLSAAAQPAH